jgi:hypothetical protein
MITKMMQKCSRAAGADSCGFHDFKPSFFIKYSSKYLSVLKAEIYPDNSTDLNIVLKIEEVVRIIGNKQAIDSK